MNTFLMIWFSCGVVSSVFAFGITLGYFQREYHQSFGSDAAFATFIALACLVFPPAIIVPILCSGFAEHGLQFRRGK